MEIVPIKTYFAFFPRQTYLEHNKPESNKMNTHICPHAHKLSFYYIFSALG